MRGNAARTLRVLIEIAIEIGTEHKLSSRSHALRGNAAGTLRVLIEVAIEIGTEHSGDWPCVLSLRGTDKSDGMTPIAISIAISIAIRVRRLNVDKNRDEKQLGLCRNENCGTKSLMTDDIPDIGTN